jgi:putative transposase
MTKLIHTRTSVHNIGYHIVWSTKYRKPVLVDDIVVSLKNILCSIAEEKEFSIEIMEVMPDHVHVFVKSNPKIPPNYIYKMLKGISATKLFLLYPNLKKSLYKGHLWNPSTFIESVGHISEDVVKKYIEGQKDYEPK